MSRVRRGADYGQGTTQPFSSDIETLTPPRAREQTSKVSLSTFGPVLTGHHPKGRRGHSPASLATRISQNHF